MANPISKPATGKLLSIEKGSPHPLGATVVEDGINFSVFSEHATGIELLLFDSCDDIYGYRITVVR